MTIYLLQNVGRLIKHYQPARPSFNDLFVHVQILKRGFREYCRRLPQVTAATQRSHFKLCIKNNFLRKGKRFLFSTYPETFTSIKFFLLLSQQFFSLHHGHKSKGNNKDGDCVTERSWQRKSSRSSSKVTNSGKRKKKTI